jgi:hypothetical protein
MTAVRTQEILHIDGHLDERAWSDAAPAGEFSQSYPNPGAKPRQRTEIRILYDNDALYVGVRAFDTHPDSIAAPLARRDALGIYSDWISISVDSYHDRRTSFGFKVNPRGVQKDEVIFNDNVEDLDWDGVWQAATSIDSMGWTVEFRIPMSQLRFGPEKNGRERIWGIQFGRDIARYNERDTWAPWTTQTPGFVSSFGNLTGLRDIPVPERLELIPYASTKLTRAPGNPANPLFHRNDISPSIGGDVKYGLPDGLTLTATVNPDFGQVEVDPAVVNLTAFETFFPEKRPFFIEGSDLFQFGQMQSDAAYSSQIFFYSRRIGRTPQLGVTGSNVAYVDEPQQTSILGALKLTGKTHGWSVGLMDGVTGQETASYVTTDGARGTSHVEPLTNYAVGRLRRDFGDGNTSVGAMLTATNRNVADALVGSALRARAFFGGVDFDHTWGSRNWLLSGYLAASRVDGTPSAITATQLSSTHYYQRPDASYLAVDSTRTSLVGHMAEVSLVKRGKWFGSLDYKEASPGFEINDLGFIPRSDYRAIVPDVGYRSNDPGRIFRDFTISGASFAVWNFGNTLIRQNNVLTASGDFNNSWTTYMSLSYAPSQLNDELTRGGPIALLPSQWNMDVYVGSDSHKPVIVSGEVQYQHDVAGGLGRSLNLSVELRPSSFVDVTVGPTITSNNSTNQYVQPVSDPLATSTYGRRYVFADLHQTTLSLDTRLDLTFSPNLTLQLYAQPFVSAGRYSAFKEFLAPRTRRFGVYGADDGTISRDDDGTYTIDPDASGPARSFLLNDPSFNLRSLQGDAVLRWQYRPGSAIFFVWQQQRSSTTSVPDFDFTRDVGAVFREPATNVFLVKATFWLGR